MMRPSLIVESSGGGSDPELEGRVDGLEERVGAVETAAEGIGSLADLVTPTIYPGEFVHWPGFYLSPMVIDISKSLTEMGYPTANFAISVDGGLEQIIPLNTVYPLDYALWELEVDLQAAFLTHYISVVRHGGQIGLYLGLEDGVEATATLDMGNEDGNWILGLNGQQINAEVVEIPAASAARVIVQDHLSVEAEMHRMRALLDASSQQLLDLQVRLAQIGPLEERVYELEGLVFALEGRVFALETA